MQIRTYDKSSSLLLVKLFPQFFDLVLERFPCVLDGMNRHLLAGPRWAVSTPDEVNQILFYADQRATTLLNGLGKFARIG
jgi:hypothetical protein